MSRSVPVVVIAAYHYFGWRPAGEDEHRRLVLGDDGRGMVFATRADAEDWIEEQDQRVYSLSHNEYSRPTYHIRPVSRLPRRLRWSL